ncbi:50S ribosomal protein L29 [bacterium]|nr:50S ribosomal protein L29 [bacterium]
MRIEDVRQMTRAELEQTLEDKLEALQNLRFQHATHQLDNPLQLRMVRRDVARIKTVLHQQDAA